MKKSVLITVLTLALTLTLVFFSGDMTQTAQAAPPVGSIIQDPAFYAAVLEIIGEVDGYVITADDVKGITWLNVDGRGIISLSGIEYFIALEGLSCVGVYYGGPTTPPSPFKNMLTSLDLTSNTALKELRCNENQLTSLKLPNSTTLEEVNCSGNLLTSLDVSMCTALESLYCRGNKLLSLDVSENIALAFLDCAENDLTTLDVSKNTALNLLSCSGNKLTVLEVSMNTALSALYCDANLLTTLDVTGLALRSLDVRWNNIPDESTVKGFTGTWGERYGPMGFFFHPQRGSLDNLTIYELAEAERMHMRESNITVDIDVDTSTLNSFSQGNFQVIGAAFNTVPNSTVIISFTKPDNGVDIDKNLYDINKMVQVEITIDGVGIDSHNLLVPITIIAHIPSGLGNNPDNFRILHYKNDGTMDVITPIINGNVTCTFTISSFSTFVFVDLITSDSHDDLDDVPKTGDITGTADSFLITAFLIFMALCIVGFIILCRRISHRDKK